MSFIIKAELTQTQQQQYAEIQQKYIYIFADCQTQQEVDTQRLAMHNELVAAGLGVFEKEQVQIQLEDVHRPSTIPQQSSVQSDFQSNDALIPLLQQTSTKSVCLDDNEQQLSFRSLPNLFVRDNDSSFAMSQDSACPPPSIKSITTQGLHQPLLPVIQQYEETPMPAKSQPLFKKQDRKQYIIGVIAKTPVVQNMITPQLKKFVFNSTSQVHRQTNHKAKFTVVGSTVHANLQGKTSNNSAQLMARQGLHITHNQMKNSSSFNGGHSFQRNAINLLSQNAYQKVINSVIREPNTYFVLYFLGSKYNVQSNILLKALQRHMNWLFVPQRNRLNQYDINYHNDNLSTYNTMRASANAAGRLYPVRHHYMDQKWKTVKIINHSYKKVVHVCIAIDVIPYYIQKRFLSRQIDRWVIVGNNYIPYPGTYPHHQQGGSFTVFQQNGVAMLSNKPNGTGKTYDHPLRIMVQCDSVVMAAYNIFFLKYHQGNIADQIWQPILPPCSGYFFEAPIINQNLSTFRSLVSKSSALYLNNYLSSFCNLQSRDGYQIYRTIASTHNDLDIQVITNGSAISLCCTLPCCCTCCSQMMCCNLTYSRTDHRSICQRLVDIFTCNTNFIVPESHMLSIYAALYKFG